MKKKLVFITGGSKGIGFELVKEFLRKDFYVINFSRSKIPLTHENCKHVNCDLSETDAHKFFESELNSAILQSGSTIDEWILINNAGVLDPVLPVAKLSDKKAISDHFTINTITPIKFSVVFIAALKLMKSKKMIINVGSGATNQPIEGWALYGSSKAALHYFTATAALEQSRENYPVKIILFDPGNTDTNMQAIIRSTEKTNFPLVENFQQAFEKGTLNDPSKLAEKLVLKIINDTLKQGEIVSHKDLLKFKNSKF